MAASAGSAGRRTSGPWQRGQRNSDSADTQSPRPIRHSDATETPSVKRLSFTATSTAPCCLQSYTATGYAGMEQLEQSRSPVCPGATKACPASHRQGRSKLATERWATGTTGGGRHHRHAANATAAAAAVITKLNIAARERERRSTIRMDDRRGLFRSPDESVEDPTWTKWDRSTKTTGPSRTNNDRSGILDKACTHPPRNSDNTGRYST